MKTEKQLMESIARHDEILEYEDGCGLCHHKILMAEVARDIVKSGDFSNALERWDKEVKKRWQESKYFKLWQKEKAAGRDPNAAFAKRGWEP
jgi:hypothetical protein